MKPSWSSVIWSFEGAVAAALATGILVGLLHWRIDSPIKVGAFLGVVVIGAAIGWRIGMAMTRRKSSRAAAGFGHS